MWEYNSLEWVQNREDKNRRDVFKEIVESLSKGNGSTLP